MHRAVCPLVQNQFVEKSCLSSTPKKNRVDFFFGSGTDIFRLARAELYGFNNNSLQSIASESSITISTSPTIEIHPSPCRFSKRLKSFSRLPLCTYAKISFPLHLLGFCSILSPYSAAF